MERQELSIHNVIDSRRYNGASRLVLFFLAVLFLWVVDSWGSCRTTYYKCDSGTYTGLCKNGAIYKYGRCQNGVVINTGCSVPGAAITSLYCYGIPDSQGYQYLYANCIECSTVREKDSTLCVQAGNAWTSDGDGECNEPLDESVCDSKRSTCEQLGGRFSGHAIKVDGQTCCSSECNLCGKANIQRILDLKAEECCSQLLAPPADIRQCITPIQSAATCGMTMSSFSDGTNGEWACQDPDLDQTTMDRFIEKCASPGSSSSEVGSSGSNNSSSGEGGSSGEGQSSGGSPYPEGCDECPWLDSILDTLTMQKHRIEDIYLCVSVPQLCSGENDEIQFDTSMLPYIRPFMDSSMKLDSNQIKALMKLDTNLLKLDTNLLKQLAVDSVRLKNDTAKLMSDSATRQALRGGFGLLDSTTDALNDTTRKWLHRIADSIHISTDSLIKHLDSIRKTVPDTILDSILKYQKMNAEKEDSIVISSLPGLDSLLDSSLSYWRSSADSMRALHEAIEDISIRMGYILGYGDTASSDLRNDINRNTEEISSFRDSVIKYYGAFVDADSSYRVTFKDSVGSIHGGINDVKGSVDGVKVSTDSAVGVLRDIRGMLGEGSYDTSTLYDGYVNGYDTSAVQFVSDVGVAVRGAMDDTTYRGVFVQGSASSSEMDGFSLPDVDSAARALQSNVDSSYNALGTHLEGVFDTLRKEFVLIDWDSAIVAPLGMKVPNTNTCPEDCFAIDLSAAGPWFSSIKALSWGLCKSYPVLAGMNVLEFVRLILRIVTAVTCVTLGMWFIAGRRN